MRTLFGQILQQLHLVAGESAIGSGRQIAQADRPEADSFQTHDLVSDSRHQPANFAVLPFVEHDFQIRTVADRLLQPCSFDMESPLVEVHAALQRCERFGGRDSLHMAQIKLGDTISRMRHAIGQLAVVGDEQQAFRLFVEPADRENPFAKLWEQVDDSRTPRRIMVRADHSARLVEREVDLALQLDLLAIEFNLLRIRIGPECDIGDDLAIDRDSAGRDVLFALPPSVDSRRRENLREPLRSELRRSGILVLGQSFARRRIVVAIELVTEVGGVLEGFGVFLLLRFRRTFAFRLRLELIPIVIRLSRDHLGCVAFVIVVVERLDVAGGEFVGLFVGKVIRGIVELAMFERLAFEFLSLFQRQRGFEFWIRFVEIV